MEITYFPDDIISYIVLHLHRLSVITLGFSCKKFFKLIFCSRNKILSKFEFIDISIECGHLNLVQWGMSIGCYLNKRTVCALATKGGHLDILKWGMNIGCELNK